MDDLSRMLDALPEWSVPVVGVLLGAVALVALLLRALLRSLPADPQLTDIDDSELPRSVMELVEEFERVGFSRIAPAQEVPVHPPGSIVPLAHRERPFFGAVSCIRVGQEAVISCDIVSLLRHELSGLTTGSEVLGGTAPAWPGALRQLLPGARPEELLSRHEAALAFLEQRGLPARAVRAAEFEPALRQSFRLQRHTFLRAPLRNLARCVWRATARRNPHVGPLDRQAIAETQIAALRQGLWPDDRARRAFDA